MDSSLTLTLKIKSLIRVSSALMVIFILHCNSIPTVEGSTNIPYLYLGPKVTKCRTDSAEQFYREVALPSVISMREATNGFFGVLMDKLEVSTSDLDAGEKEKLEKQWIRVMETIKDSLEPTYERIKRSWGILVALSDTEPMPWEIWVQRVFSKELVNDVEYQYAMLGAIIKAGVKEIVGTLQYQVANVIKEMESHVAQQSKKDENVTELNLLQKMEKSFKKIKPNFTGNLIKKIVERAISARIPPDSGNKFKNQASSSSSGSDIYFAEAMQQAMLVFKAFREKGHIYPNFWSGLTKILKEDGELHAKDFEMFVKKYGSNEELFIDNVFAILTSTVQIQ